jgi:FtsP/CotA-like multicopper oxidase with cupredoxin domain
MRAETRIRIMPKDLRREWRTALNLHFRPEQALRTMRLTFSAWAVALAVAAAACTGAATATPQAPTGHENAPVAGGSVRTFELTAAASRIELRPRLTASVWAFNGTVPGPLIRVRQGDLIVVHLHNRLPVGTTIHWHGLAVPNGQDGVAGVTQDPVPPGRSATYSFIARTAGTYWYHSHQRGAEQVDRGLYGLLVVDPRDAVPEPSADHFLVYDEWPIGLEMPSPPVAGSPAMSAYVTVSVNGKSGTAIDPIRVAAGKKIRLRMLNAGYLVHFVRVDGVQVVVRAFDGHEVSGGGPTHDVLPLGPGERMDVEFTAPNRPFWIELQDGFPPSADAAVEVDPGGGSAAQGPPAGGEIRPVLDVFTYGARASDSPWPTGAVATREFTLNLTEVSRGGGSMAGSMPGMEMGDVLYEINGKVFPATDTLEVSGGDRVAITFVNQGRMEHSMHLHGHAFQLLERNGLAVAGVIVKDTVVVRPGMSVTVGFVADNPGWWMIHCHELHHSAGGMMTLLHYAGAPRLAELGGPFESAPD